MAAAAAAASRAWIVDGKVMPAISSTSRRGIYMRRHARTLVNVVGRLC